MNPGPVDPSVLWQQDLHRSENIWEKAVEHTLQTRNSDKVYEVDARVERYLYSTGFYGMYHLGFTSIDRPLVTALVERWRPETHTFHLPPGEITVTLQDVEILLGVSIDGKPIISNDCIFKKDQWRGICRQLIGVDPGDNVVGTKIKMNWLRDWIAVNPLQPNATEEQIRCRTRATILLLLGGQYLSDKSGNSVKLRYLYFLEDLDHCKDYSWGSAILAVLYRQMCDAANGTSDIAGPLILLQLWAWIRFPSIRPVQLNRLIDFPAIEDPALPTYTYGYRWVFAGKTYNPDVVGHNLRHFRDQFDLIRDDQVIWLPYDDILDDLPNYCCAGKEIWRAKVPLICFEFVEHYNPDRVLRQFGMRQGIPQACLKNYTLHEHSGQGNTATKWATKWKDFVAQWDNRHDSLVEGDYHQGWMPVNMDYMPWYKKITRLCMRQVNFVPEKGFHPMASTITLMQSALEVSYNEFQAINNQRMVSYLEDVFSQLHLDIPQLHQHNRHESHSHHHESQENQEDSNNEWVDNMLIESTPVNIYEHGGSSGLCHSRDERDT